MLLFGRLLALSLLQKHNFANPRSFTPASRFAFERKSAPFGNLPKIPGRGACHSGGDL